MQRYQIGRIWLKTCIPKTKLSCYRKPVDDMYLFPSVCIVFVRWVRMACYLPLGRLVEDIHLILKGSEGELFTTLSPGVGDRRRVSASWMYCYPTAIEDTRSMLIFSMGSR